MKQLKKFENKKYLSSGLSSLVDGLTDNPTPAATTMVAAQTSAGVIESIEIGNLLSGGLPILPDGEIWVGDGGGTAQSRTPSNDVSMTNTGAFTITNFSGDVNTEGNNLTSGGISAYGLNASGSTWNATLASGASTVSFILGQDDSASSQFIIRNASSQTLFSVDSNGYMTTGNGILRLGGHKTSTTANNDHSALEFRYANGNIRGNIIQYEFDGITVNTGIHNSPTSLTINTFIPHYLQTGDLFTLAGFTPANWNGVQTVVSATETGITFNPSAGDPLTDATVIGTLRDFRAPNATDFEDSMVFDTRGGGGFRWRDNSNFCRMQILTSGRIQFPTNKNSSTINNGGYVNIGNSLEIGEDVINTSGFQGFGLRINKSFTSEGSYSGGEGSSINTPRHLEIFGRITRDSDSNGALEANLIRSYYTFDSASALTPSRLSMVRIGNMTATHTGGGSTVITDLAGLYVDNQTASAGVTATNIYSAIFNDKVKIKDNGSANYGTLDANTTSFIVDSVGTGGLNLLHNGDGLNIDADAIASRQRYRSGAWTIKASSPSVENFYFVNHVDERFLTLDKRLTTSESLIKLVGSGTELGTGITGVGRLEMSGVSRLQYTNDSNDKIIHAVGTNSLGIVGSNAINPGGAAGDGLKITGGGDKSTHSQICFYNYSDRNVQLRLGTGPSATTKASNSTPTSVVANELNDTTANFSAANVAVGDRVYNFTAGTSALVTVVDSAIKLTLDADIFPNTSDNYIVGANEWTFRTSGTSAGGTDIAGMDIVFQMGSAGSRGSFILRDPSGAGSSDLAFTADGTNWTVDQKIEFQDAIGLHGVVPPAQASAMTASDATVIDATYGAAEEGVINNLRIRVDELEAMLDASTGIGVVA